MKKLLLIIIIMATWTVVGCETVRQVKAGCFGHWVGHTDGSRSGPKKGTIWSNRHNVTPYRQCVENEGPYKNTDKRPYG